MAYLWHKPNDEKWTATELHSAAFLRRGSVECVRNIGRTNQRHEVLLYPNTGSSWSTTWVLLALADAEVRINDALLETGIRVIVDRDAIRVSDAPTAYFSTERLACIEVYPDEAPVFCPRCKLMISEGDSAVCCSQCGVWHHEQAPEGKSCWSYSKTCALCDQSTDLDSAGFRWTPEVLWS